MRHLRILYFAALFLPYGAYSADAPCSSTLVTEPVQPIIAESQPQIRWEPVAQADYYRIRLVSRVPEGKTLSVIDTRVSATSFKPPQPLSDSRARVTATVWAYCGDRMGPPSDLAQGGRFTIDVTRACPSPQSIHLADEDARKNIAVWTATAKAESYQVNVYSVRSGALIAQREARETRVKLDGIAERSVVLAIRPRCGGVWGEPGYQTLSVGAP